jgi:hypothetical protein
VIEVFERISPNFGRYWRIAPIRTGRHPASINIPAKDMCAVIVRIAQGQSRKQRVVFSYASMRSEDKIYELNRELANQGHYWRVRWDSSTGAFSIDEVGIKDLL